MRLLGRDRVLGHEAEERGAFQHRRLGHLELAHAAELAASEDVEKKRQALAGVELNRQELHLGKFQRRVDSRLREWQSAQLAARLWKKDYTVWAKAPEPELSDRLGWLELPEAMEKQLRSTVEWTAQLMH
jgi:hypothetical protein